MKGDIEENISHHDLRAMPLLWMCIQSTLIYPESSLSFASSHSLLGSSGMWCVWIICLGMQLQYWCAMEYVFIEFSVRF